MSDFTEKDLEDLYAGEFEALQKVATDFVNKMTTEQVKKNLILLILGDMLKRRKARKGK